MRIGIIGDGVVGHATARAYMERHEVRVFDKVPEKSTHSLIQTLDTDLVFICLPEMELCHVIGYLSTEERKKNFVLRSTVPIGTTQRLRKEYNLPNLVHSPEFLTARCAVTDAQLPARNIIGWKFEGEEFWECSPCGKILESIYEDRFPGIPVHMMSANESEAVKLFTNAFFAVKVAYFNEINLLAKNFGLDWDTVLKGMLSDGRISHSHTQVPGPDGKYGFGGACLPKDLATLVLQNNEWSVNEVDQSDNLLRAVLKRNEVHRDRT